MEDETQVPEIASTETVETPVEEVPVETAPVEELLAVEPEPAVEEPPPQEPEPVVEEPPPLETAPVVDEPPAETGTEPVEAGAEPVEVAPVEEPAPKKRTRRSKKAAPPVDGEAPVEAAPAAEAEPEPGPEPVAPSKPSMPLDDVLISAVESILFAADRPISVRRLQEVFGDEGGPTKETLIEALESLRARYQAPQFGFELRGEAEHGVHFVTKVANVEWVRKFLATKPFRLGRSALEVLSIIAYRQPVTRAEIDQVRGIDSSHLLRVLIERGLVKMDGKAEVPGRPVQYATTPKFLETVGLVSLQQLPPLTELEQLQGNAEDPIKKLEQGLERIINDSPTSREMEARNDEGLGEIDTLIQAAQRADSEVYESADHAEVSRENQEAVAAFQAFMKPIRRKKAQATLSYEDLTQGAPLPEEAFVVTPPDSELVN